MSSTRLKTALAALVLGGTAVLAAPAAAGATGTGAPAAASTSASPAESGTVGALADGYLYAYEHIDRGGAYCRWYGDDADWSTCSPGGNMRNKASSLWNNGYPGSYDDVALYWGTNYTGAPACLRNGVYWNNLTGLHFNRPGSSGHGETINDNISSHRWVNSC
ncbi:peptidase inhibitor family I36 protein [Streptomyces sp. NPDC059637]|uniref:peptidase inhibitor family I36 protein n=1 Tax=Streptomyces sp. NPDC059637 TaxID=3347752 RepID=UPI0036A3C0C9